MNQFSFVPDSADKLDAVRKGYRHMLTASDRRLNAFVRVAFYVALLLVVFPGVFVFGLMGTYFQNGIFRIVPFVLIAVISAAYYVWCTKKFIVFDRRRQARLGERQVVVTLSDDHLAWSRSGSTIKVPYQALELVFETDRIIGFVTDDAVLYLPKAVAGDASSIRNLLSSVLDKLSPEARDRSASALKSLAR